MALTVATIWAALSIVLSMGDARVRAPASIEVGCRGGSFSANQAADTDAIADAGIQVSKTAKLVAAVRVSANCDAEVIGVFSGGVITNRGEEWELRPKGARNLGGDAQVATGDPCTVPSFQKCLRLPGGGGVVALDRSRAEQSIRFISASGQSKILSTRGRARILDIAYLAAPDAPGGRLFTYVRNPAGSFVIVVETK